MITLFSISADSQPIMWDLQDLNRISLALKNSPLCKDHDMTKWFQLAIVWWIFQNASLLQHFPKEFPASPRARLQLQQNLDAAVVALDQSASGVFLQFHFYLIIVIIPIMILTSAFQLESLVLDNNKLTTVVLEVADIFHRQHFPPIANPIVCSHWAADCDSFLFLETNSAATARFRHHHHHHH